MALAPVNILKSAAMLRTVAIDGLQAKVRQAAALNFIGQSLVNYGKQNGPWTDRTTRLRNSYGVEVVDDGRMRAYFYNTAPYAVYVELMPGRWVLSGAVKQLLPGLKKEVAAALSIRGLSSTMLETGLGTSKRGQAFVAAQRRRR